jgi:hypothetical protein
MDRSMFVKSARDRAQSLLAGCHAGRGHKIDASLEITTVAVLLKKPRLDKIMR